jgi:uncharacterized protein YdeI (YjbR/CyaY-like superfamily)
MPDVAAWHDWLVVHHTEPLGVWLRLAKKGVTEPTSLTYLEALHEALCFGWIDGQARKCDAATSFQRFTPRRARSPWSQRNVDFVAVLTAEGRMQSAGLAEVERAKADGRWAAAYSQASLADPPDLMAAIAEVPAAAAMYEILTKQNSFALAFRLNSLKRPETRARRVAEFVDMLARGETFYPQKKQRPDV